MGLDSDRDMIRMVNRCWYIPVTGSTAYSNAFIPSVRLRPFKVVTFESQSSLILNFLIGLRLKEDDKVIVTSLFKFFISF